MCIFAFYIFLKTQLNTKMKQLIQRGLLLVALSLGMAFHLFAQSTQMTIYLNNGEEKTYYMSESDRVYFEDNETLVVEIIVNAKSDRYNLADIRKITCAETENVAENSGTEVYLSPNPVHNTVMLRNLNGNETVHIYTLDGRKVMSVEASENRLIDISALPIGLYLVKTEHQTLKMIKL